MNAPESRSHEDIYNRQQSTDIQIERIHGKLDAIREMLQLRNQQSIDHRNASDKILDGLRIDANEHAKSVWERFSLTDTAIGQVRLAASSEMEAHKSAVGKDMKDLYKEIGELDGKLIWLGGGMAVVTFLLVLFAPVIQHQFLQKIPATGSPEHYELKK